MVTSCHNIYNLGSYSYVDLVAMTEHIGPSFTQGHYVSYILKQQNIYGTR